MTYMRFIAHRGNIDGKRIDVENSPEYINQALHLGYDVEVDVRCHQGRLYLGHDEPQYEVDISFLRGSMIWCHAKDLSALSILIDDPEIHCFFHDHDDATLTSEGFVWVYPGKQLVSRSICVLPELVGKKDTSLLYCAGICSDVIKEYREWYNGIQGGKLGSFTLQRKR